MYDAPGRRAVGVNYPALLAPFRLAAVGHSLRAGLSRNAIVPRGPLWFERAKLSRHHERRKAPFERRGRGPAFSCRSTVEAAGRSSAATRAYRTRPVDCPAGLIPGVLALYPQAGNGSSTRSRSSSPSVGCEAVRPRTTDAGLLAASPDPDVCGDGSKSRDGPRGKNRSPRGESEQRRALLPSLPLASLAAEEGGSASCTATA